MQIVVNVITSICM